MFRFPLPRLAFSQAFARVVSGAVLAGFLFCTYEIIRIEVDAQWESYPPAELEEITPSGSAPGSGPKTSAPVPSQPPTKLQRPRKAKPLPREGSRREWYEKRKRRWFTPPDAELDRGLPRRGSKFLGWPEPRIDRLCGDFHFLQSCGAK